MAYPLSRAEHLVHHPLALKLTPISAQRGQWSCLGHTDASVNNDPQFCIVHQESVDEDAGIPNARGKPRQPLQIGLPRYR
ncbi:hypothetical protein OSB_26500 [Octadecabacter temperatus]|uniref:Uncharacterized protein n=1 Tax=Octadecabacter temperatus TaxID=1458307 RepID=A0A0K0Y8H6_9RHOB|nr:hypothetical protein OSB_26500 [Octadecabacter temperatus]